MANENLTKAKAAKNDEFYTQFDDIEREINAYLDFDANFLRDKTVLLPCDDPEWSNFTKFFVMNFHRLGIRKLVSTSYAINLKHGAVDYTPSEQEMVDPKYDSVRALTNGKIFTLNRDAGRNPSVERLDWNYLEGDGDFRSAEVTALRDEADFIVTNPPFSLFREFLSWVNAADCKFLMIGNINAVSMKEVFPLIASKKIWLGNGFRAGNAFFRTPVLREYADGVLDASSGLVKFRNCCWYTNVDHGRRHEPLKLMSMADNLKYNKKLSPKPAYKRYDNYDVVEIPFTDSIPSDFEGPMAVPISYLEKYCPDQFDILDANNLILDGKAPFKGHGLIKDKDGTIDGVAKYVRLVIQRRKSSAEQQ